MVEKDEPIMKKATRFTFVNNKDTAISAPDRVVAARADDDTKNVASGPTVGKN